MVLAGGSGHVGVVLARRFHAAGNKVIVLSRAQRNTPWRTVHWDGTNFGNWTSELDGADVLVNLAGRSVNCRYTPPNRREIMQSRVQPTRLLGRALRQLTRPPRLWINASTATIYRHSYDRAMDETGEIGGAEPDIPSSWRFSVDVATSWERAFFSSATPQTRKLAIRSAMTMSPDRGGIFDVLLRLVRFGLGGTAGSGQQYVSWIHEADFLRCIDHLISREDIDGVVNLASPNPLPNREFMSALRRAWGTRIGLPASKWMLEVGTFLLRTESELVLKSRRVVPGRLLQSGCQFQFPDWVTAAEDLVQRWMQLGRS
jgi:uncharacterized protein (TIGR01777 family)